MTPRCSIIIPVHGGASLTRACLDACERSGATEQAEIVVVDDASPDATPRVLESFGGRIRVVGHERNTGFALACNDGARAARGELLVFLNNDATPQPGWLDALVETIDAHPEAAVVGSKLLHPNDTIQHAGVVVCQDRYPRHVYAGFPADHPAVNRARTFQAVTGASMLVRRSAFESVGGFDPTFTNAYEDHDLCFRLRERAHEVRYCPTSVAYHLEGMTRTGRDRELDVATLRFRMRWAHRLQPDDLRYYVEDGLLGIAYAQSFPLRLRVSPLLATIERGERDVDRLLATRAEQVRTLLRENAELRTRAGETTPVIRTGDGDLRPPEELSYWVGGEFDRVGNEFLEYFVSLGGLRPGDRVLDVGCGVGRMAVPLLRHLDESGSYEGFDVMEQTVAWCRANVTPRHPGFRFRHLDLRNAFYNPGGRVNAAEATFPYESRSFDFVLLTSVFTHLLPEERDRFLAEIARVLRPGGTCFATFFLRNEESIAFLRAGFSPGLAFRVAGRGYWSVSRDVPETAVAYDEADVRAAYDAVGLTIAEPIRFGTWCGRFDGLSYQDLVLATRS